MAAVCVMLIICLTLVDTVQDAPQSKLIVQLATQQVTTSVILVTVAILCQMAPVLIVLLFHLPTVKLLIAVVV